MVNESEDLWTGLVAQRVFGIVQKTGIHSQTMMQAKQIYIIVKKSETIS